MTESNQYIHNVIAHSDEYTLFNSNEVYRRPDWRGRCASALPVENMFSGARFLG